MWKNIKKHYKWQYIYCIADIISLGEGVNIAINNVTNKLFFDTEMIYGD